MTPMKHTPEVRKMLAQQKTAWWAAQENRARSPEVRAKISATLKATLAAKKEAK